MRIGITGSFQNNEQFNERTYKLMCETVSQILQKLSLNPEDIELVTFASLWSGHIASTLFIASHFGQTTPISSLSILSVATPEETLQKISKDEVEVFQRKASITSMLSDVECAKYLGCKTIILENQEQMDTYMAENTDYILFLTLQTGDHLINSTLWNASKGTRIHIPLLTLMEGNLHEVKLYKGKKCQQLTLFEQKSMKSDRNHEEEDEEERFLREMEACESALDEQYESSISSPKRARIINEEEFKEI